MTIGLKTFSTVTRATPPLHPTPFFVEIDPCGPLPLYCIYSYLYKIDPMLILFVIDKG